MILALNARRQLVTAQNAARQELYYCPGCHAPVVLKRGQVVLAHFAHQPHAHCTTFSEGETAEHLTGKRQLADWFYGPTRGPPTSTPSAARYFSDPCRSSTVSHRVSVFTTINSAVTRANGRLPAKRLPGPLATRTAVFSRCTNARKSVEVSAK